VFEILTWPTRIWWDIILTSNLQASGRHEGSDRVVNSRDTNAVSSRCRPVRKESIIKMKFRLAPLPLTLTHS